VRILLPPSRTVRAGAPQEAPPLERYTGVLYRALGAEQWSAASRRWAAETLLVHTAEHGLVGAAAAPGEPVDLARLMREAGPLVDLRSKEYARRAPVPPGAWTLRVVSEDGDGRRLTVSHWNKHHKGVLVAALARDRPRPRRLDGLLRWAAGAGLRLERAEEGVLELVVS